MITTKMMMNMNKVIRRVTRRDTKPLRTVMTMMMNMTMRKIMMMITTTRITMMKTKMMMITMTTTMMIVAISAETARAASRPAADAHPAGEAVLQAAATHQEEEVTEATLVVAAVAHQVPEAEAVEAVLLVVAVVHQAVEDLHPVPTAEAAV
jgi:hypothetical protein